MASLWTDSQFRAALLASAKADNPDSEAKLRAWDRLKEAETICGKVNTRYSIIHNHNHNRRSK